MRQETIFTNELINKFKSLIKLSQTPTVDMNIVFNTANKFIENLKSQVSNDIKFTSLKANSGLHLQDVTSTQNFLFYLTSDGILDNDTNKQLAIYRPLANFEGNEKVDKLTRNSAP